jgi:hypothetical protein
MYITKEMLLLLLLLPMNVVMPYNTPKAMIGCSFDRFWSLL